MVVVVEVDVVVVVVKESVVVAVSVDKSEADCAAVEVLSVPTPATEGTIGGTSVVVLSAGASVVGLWPLG